MRGLILQFCTPGLQKGTRLVHLFYYFVSVPTNETELFGFRIDPIVQEYLPKNGQ